MGVSDDILEMAVESFTSTLEEAFNAIGSLMQVIFAQSLFLYKHTSISIRVLQQHWQQLGLFLMIMVCFVL
jgi:hypothetical protein